MFNGRDLAGWVPVNVAPSTFAWKEGMVVTTGKPTGVMRTERMYENFIVEFEWRHMVAGGNAGFFIWSDAVTAPGVPFTRGVEVQVLDGRESEWYTSHGDVFPIHGAVMTPDRPHPKGSSRCLPSEKRALPSPQWNHYRVTAVNGTIKLAVNGKEVSGGYDISPRKGYLCLESEGSECHFRNLRIKELPPSQELRPEQIAAADAGFVSLYTGVDLSGWKADAGHWKVKDWILDYDGKAAGSSASIVSDRADAAHDLILDCRSPDKQPRTVTIGARTLRIPGDGKWHRHEIAAHSGPIAIAADGAVQLANLYARRR